ncbi:hypothetical protein [Phaeodactylibacter sp.]|uniref:hypothetical protein n=1 Tax=Phaeodactylibacter sp. TaxID=1940289 RepID=UPI0026010AA3|nr:hypothetical protein [Phaeodactylibacter sp.]MCI4648419.1 hypothetical protein [Phaeodactylibacter sp.]MCI5093149.1 hypothetical protein [Phaeodactylibacter sp.]
MVLILSSNGALGKQIAISAILVFGVKKVILSDYKPDRLAQQQRLLHGLAGSEPAVRLIDVRSAESIRNNLHGVDLVVVALQQQEPIVQQVCSENGISSIDLSVNPDFLEQCLSLSPMPQGTQLIGGGLFPGLSGILAKEVYAKGPEQETIDIGLLQSTHGTNGKTGVADMLQILDKKVEWKSAASSKAYPGFSLKKRFDFPLAMGAKTLRLAAFIEREYLCKAGVPANYWTAFDKAYFNEALALAARFGLLRLFQNPKVGPWLSALIAQPNGGKRKENIGLAAQRSKQTIAWMLSADYEATAACTVAFSQLMLTRHTDSAGVKFPFELFTLNDVRPFLKDVILAEKISF